MASADRGRPSVDADEKRRGVVTAFSSALRASGLNGVVEVQQAMVFLGRVLEDISLDHPIPLGRVEEYLESCRAPQTGIDQTLLTLKAREDRLAVRFLLPARLERLSAQEREAIVGEALLRMAPLPMVGGGRERSSPSGVRAAAPAVPS